MDKIRAVRDAATEPWVVLFGEFLADMFPDRRVPGGAPFNVACHLAGFGVQAQLASRLGKDPLGNSLSETLRRCKVGDRLVQADSSRGSGRVEVIINADGHRFEIPPEQAFDHVDGDELASALARMPGPPALLYFGTLAQRNPVSRAALARLLAATTAPRFVDLNLRPPWIDDEVLAASLATADIVKLGEEELFEVGARLHLPGSDHDPRSLGQRLRTQFGVRQLFVTCGGRGAWVLSGSEVLQVPAVRVGEAGGDSVGAGDAFSAVCMLGHLLDWPLSLTLTRATEFAAAICGVKGAVPGEIAIYEDFRKEWRL